MPTARYILACDQVRREDNGKFIIIGLYTPDMAVQQIPFAMPTLAFFMCLESDRPGNFQFRMRLDHLESGRVLAEGMGGVQFNLPGLGFFPVQLGGLQFPGAGAYTLSLTFEGQREPITHQFNVLLNVPGAPGTPGMPPVGPR